MCIKWKVYLKMNILQILPSGEISGIKTYTLNISKGLIKRGHKVVLLCSDPRTLQEFKLNGVDGYDSIFKILDILKNEKIQIVNIQHRTSLIFLVWLLKKKIKIPYVVTIHNPKYSDIFKIMFSDNKIITLSKAVTNHLIKDLKLPKECISESFLAVDTEKFHPEINIEKQLTELKLIPDLPVVTFVSRMSYNKGKVVFKILDTVHLLPKKFQLLILGDGPLLKSVYESGQKINRCYNFKIVNVLGRREDLAEIMNLSDLVIGTATVALEAMACRKPVIGVGRFGYLGIVSEENFKFAVETLFCDHAAGEELTTEKIASDISKIIFDNSYANSIAEFGLKVIKEKFNIDKAAEDLEQIFQKYL